MTRLPITGPERIRLAAETIMCERTITRVYRGEGTDHSRARVYRAALALGLPLPPSRSSPSPTSSSSTPDSMSSPRR